MSNSIGNLLFEAGGNLSRPANFSVEITFPKNLNNQKTSHQYDILCKNISIPEIDTKKVEITYKGSTIPIMTRVDYNRSLNVTLIIDEKHEILRDLITWQKGLDKNTIKPNEDIKLMFNRQTKQDILGSINLIVKDWNENEVAKYIFEGVYPTKIANIEFDTSGVSGFLELQVEFSFLIMNKDESFENMNVGVAQRLVDATITALDKRVNSITSDIEKSLGDIFSDNLPDIPELLKDKEEMIKSFSNLLNKGV